MGEREERLADGEGEGDGLLRREMVDNLSRAWLVKSIDQCIRGIGMATIQNHGQNGSGTRS